MSHKIFAIAFVALMGIPFAAQAQENVRDERGVSVVPLKKNAGSTQVQQFVVRPPEGVTPEGNNGNQGGNNANQGNNGTPPVATFIVRPPEGVTPEGNNGGNNNAGNNGGNNGGGQIAQPIIVQPQPQQIIARPQGTPVRNNPVVASNTPLRNDIVNFLPQNNVAQVQPRNNVAVAATPQFAQIDTRFDTAAPNTMTVAGVDSGTDLYNLLVEGGYAVKVHHAAKAGEYVLIAHAARQPYAHVLLVKDDDGAVLNYKTVAWDAGYTPAPVQSYGHRRVVENCDKPRYVQRTASVYGHRNWLRY